MANTAPIPPKVRAEIEADPFMAFCIYEDDNAPNHYCSGRVEWEHACLYNGKRINEPWAIVPCCTSHNRGNGLVKDYNRYRALIRADLDDITRRYPKHDWKQQLKYLKSKYEGAQN